MFPKKSIRHISTGRWGWAVDQSVHLACCVRIDSLKQVVTVPLLNTKKQLFSRVLVGVAHLGLSLLHRNVPHIGRKLQSFTNNDDVSTCVKNSSLLPKNQNKQIYQQLSISFFVL